MALFSVTSQRQRSSSQAWMQQECCDEISVYESGRGLDIGDVLTGCLEDELGDLLLIKRHANYRKKSFADPE